MNKSSGFRFAEIESAWPHSESEGCLGILSYDNWDDFGFKTLFHLKVIDERGKLHHIGAVKIAKLGQAEGKTDLPGSPFESLGSEYFSLGQDEEYYEHLQELDPEVRETVLTRLRDVAFSEEIWNKAESEMVMTTSLLRFVPYKSVPGQYRRIAKGGNVTESFNFAYHLPKRISSNLENGIGFKVDPNSFPPTNLHVFIGRNGVGKSYLFNLMSKALVSRKAVAAQSGKFSSLLNDPDDLGFTRLVALSFSAFDQFEDIAVDRPDIDYIRIGLNSRKKRSRGTIGPKSPGDLAQDFADSVEQINRSSSKERWSSALSTLESDPFFAATELREQFGANESISDRNRLLETYRDLSSGHKIVLLMLASLVEQVREKTLVLIDEPESHLHPPLLSAFIRSLSELMRELNGLCVVATHSPVVLQEAPRSCVWIINRFGMDYKFSRPKRETFGENVGSLTCDVFGLEVTDSGFHKLLKQAATEHSSYEEALAKFNGHLGAEARAILRTLLALNDNEKRRR